MKVKGDTKYIKDMKLNLNISRSSQKQFYFIMYFMIYENGICTVYFTVKLRDWLLEYVLTDDII